MRSKRFQGAVLAVVLAAALLVHLKQQSIIDWWRLRGYTAPATVVALATADTMTPKATHLFYVNKPVLASGGAFTSQCPAGTEKTVVLGCYVGNDNGIYLYDVTDNRLDGVEQVTAAHEMLHAAYNRLSSSERKRVNSLLNDYYKNQLSDQRIKDTIASYKKSEPRDVVNEMHSIFGTEIADLPAPLESYYAQYFISRKTVAGFTARYQSEFASRQQAVTRYDIQLKAFKAQIDAAQSELERQKNELEAASNKLQSLQTSGQIDTYNNSVGGYNQRVDTYNALLSSTKTLISQYNQIVEDRNGVVLEEQQLAKELSATSLPE